MKIMNDQPANKKRGRGRPTKYKSEFCDQIIAHGKEGKGVAEIAAAFDVTRETIYDWLRSKTEFSDAYVRAKVHCQAWWEEKGRTMLEGGAMNAGLWKLNMVNRFPGDWKDKTESKLQMDVSGIDALFSKIDSSAGVHNTTE